MVAITELVLGLMTEILFEFRFTTKIGPDDNPFGSVNKGIGNKVGPTKRGIREMKDTNEFISYEWMCHIPVRYACSIKLWQANKDNKAASKS